MAAVIFSKSKDTIRPSRFFMLSIMFLLLCRFPRPWFFPMWHNILYMFAYLVYIFSSFHATLNAPIPIFRHFFKKAHGIFPKAGATYCKNGTLGFWIPIGHG